MRRFIVLAVAAAVTATGVAIHSFPARAQVPMVTITFKLTINGTPPPADSFLAQWGETGLTFCGPCVGGGHTYVQTTPWPKGTAFIHFRFTRVTNSAPHQGAIVHVQDFGQQPISGTADTTVRGFFSYAAAPQLSVPATGKPLSFPMSAVLVTAGSALLLLSTRRRRRSGSDTRVQ